jgi:hypothetical protein
MRAMVITIKPAAATPTQNAIAILNSRHLFTDTPDLRADGASAQASVPSAPEMQRHGLP